jgi:hypothetical protein
MSRKGLRLGPAAERLGAGVSTLTLNTKLAGWICSSKVAQKDVTNYGFLNPPFCGAGS